MRRRERRGETRAERMRRETERGWGSEMRGPDSGASDGDWHHHDGHHDYDADQDDDRLDYM